MTAQVSRRARRQEAMIARFGGRYEEMEREASAPGAAADDLRRIAVLVLQEEEDGPPDAAPELAEEVSGLLAPSLNSVLDAVARHPNTPPDVLVELIGRCRDAVCANPVLPLLPLEAPGLLLDAPPELLRHLLRSPALPASLARLLADAGGAEIIEEAALHVSLAGEVETDKWREAVQEYWRTTMSGAVARSDETPGDRLYLAELTEVGLWPEWLGPAPRPVPDGELEAEAGRQIDEALRRGAGWGRGVAGHLRAASEPDAPVECLARYTEHPDWPVRLAVLRNPATPAALVAAGARHSYPDLFARAATLHPNADPESLVEMLAPTHDASVRALVRRHPLVRSAPGLSARAATAVRKFLLAGGFGAFCRDTPPEAPALCRFLGVVRADERERDDTPDDEKAADERATRSRREAADSDDWKQRLAAALSLRPRAGARRRPAAFLPPDRARMEALADDGNRLVRAAARARLADPCRGFRW